MLKTLLGGLLCLSFHTAYADDIIEIEHIWLTQSVHVAGDSLCQDGQSFYFKSLEHCLETQSDLNCQKNLEIGPIHFIEKIELDEQRSVSHFYSLQTHYEYLRYELTSFYPIPTYDLVESKQIPIPYCKGKPKLQPKKQKRIRKVEPGEYELIIGLVQSGVTIVNSPYGSLKGMVSQLKNKNVVDEGRPKLRSPLCNENLDASDIIHQASGEWSGNGVIALEALSQWHESSIELQVVSKKSSSNHFGFYCKREEKSIEG